MPDKKATRLQTFVRDFLRISEPDRPPSASPSATPTTKEEKEGWVMYTKELEYIGRGDPLWQPCEGINVGDVGYIHHGRFEMLFPVHSLFGGQSRGVKIPVGFDESIFQKLVTSWDQPGCFHSKCVKPIGQCDETRIFTPLPEDKADTFVFELSGIRGAALVTRYPIHRMDLPVALEDLFHKYLKDNYDHWVSLAKVKSSQQIKPVLVSGFDLVRDFVMVSYPKSGPLVKSPEPIIEAMFESSPPHCQGEWSFQSVPHIQEQVSTEFNQCVFIRSHTLRRRGNIPKKIRAAAGPQDLGSGDNKRGGFPELPVQSDTESEPIDGGDSRGQLGPIAVGDSSKLGGADWETRYDEGYDKWDVIADYIFQKSDAVTALMHHRDVAGILMAGDGEDLPALLEKWRLPVVTKDGVGRILSQGIEPQTRSQLQSQLEIISSGDITPTRRGWGSDSDTISEVPTDPPLRGIGGVPQSETSSIPNYNPFVSGFHLSVTDVDVDEGEPVESSCYVVDPTAAYEIKSDLKSTLYSTAGLVIDVLKESSDACTPLKSVVGALSTVLKYYDQTVANRKTIKPLIPRVQGLAKSLGAPVPKGEIRERERRVILRRKLEKVLQDLKPLEERGEVARFLNNVSDAETLTGLAEDIRDAMMEYQTALQQDIWYKNNELIDKADLTLLSGMRHTAEAGFLAGGRQGCLRGTRRDVLLQIEKWLMDKTDHRVFWLSGLAGTGKSTIAQTFAEINFAGGKLGASFFCSRDSEDRSNLRAIFPTLAFQLAHRYPLFRKQLLQVLRVNHDVGRESLNSQLEEVIVRPLKETRISTLIIIDALDECKDEQPASALLSVLSRYVHELPGVKFFITGRPEPRITDGFRLESLCPITDVLRLHNVKRPSVDEDIRLYLRTRLTDIRNTRRECDFPEEWPSSWDIDRLCKEAAGLFIYASTVVKFVSSSLHTPKERLDEIILHSQTAAHEGDMDLLYTEILKLGFQGQNLSDKGSYSRFRSVVGAVLLVFQPLSTSALSDLVQNCETPGHILTTLRSLHSLLHVPDNENDTIRALHKSFPDFLTNSHRCKDTRFFVDPSVHHNDILSSCLELMEEKLEKNICGLDDYAVLSEVEDLSSRRKKCIGSSLEYACRYWTRHLAEVPCSGTRVGETLRAIDEFLTTRLLYWIEVLSITGHLGGTVNAINEIRQWQISAGASDCRQADDSERFILENFDVIHDSPSHIYHTALPLSPSSSWLRDCYKKEFSQEARILMGLPNKRDACSRTISIEDQPSAFAYSGDIIAVGSESQTVVLLESITGNTTSILSGHEGTITSLSFSPDGTSLVSGSDDKSIKLWDRQTGGVIKTFSYTSAITSVSISLDGTTIASGAWDGTICLWDIRAGTSRSSSTRHDYEVTAVSFSPTNSRHLLSSSVDKTVRQWDVGGRRAKAHRVHPEATAVAHVAYTSDGTRFASCGGATATVRNSETGAVVATLSAPNQKIQFRCCCFSPDGRFVACAADTAIYVWDITNSEVRLVENLTGHSKRIISVVFSPSLISGSEDRSVKIWQGTTFLSDSKTAEDTSALSASAPIESVRLFVEANIVITSDSSGLVRTWDLKTGKCKSSFSTPAEGMRDTHLAGDTLLVVWRKSGEYHIWDAGKERLLRTVHSSLSTLLDLKILGDGSKILGIDDRSIEARSIKTGEYAGHIRRKQNDVWEGPLVVDGSRVWLAGSKSVGWDFGGQEVSTFSLSREFPNRLRLNFIDRTTHHSTEPALVQDATTKSQVFRLPGRYMTPGARRRWDGRYLVVCSPSGELVIIDFDCICRK